MFPKNLKYLRELHKMEQLELAQLLGKKSPSSISEWEKGKYTPKIGVLSEISKIFEVDIDDLMSVDLSSSPPDNDISLNSRYKLKFRRLELGLTLEQVGDIVGVSESTVRKWENGIIENIKRDKIILLAKALQVSPLFIIQDDFDDSIINDIQKVSIQLNKQNQKDVYDFAEMKLSKQNESKVIEMTKKEDPEVYKVRKKAEKEEREIEKEVQEMMDNYRYVAYGGEDAKEMNQETLELMEAAIRHSIIGSREDAKEKFTPKKYRKDKND